MYDSQAPYWACTTQGVYSIYTIRIHTRFTGQCLVLGIYIFGAEIYRFLTEGPSMPNRPFHPSSFRRNIHSGGSFAGLAAALAKLARLRLIPGRGIVPCSFWIPAVRLLCTRYVVRLLDHEAKDAATQLHPSQIFPLSQIDRLLGVVMTVLTADPSRPHGLPGSLFVSPWVRCSLRLLSR